MKDLKTLETKLNALVAKGEMIEATEQYYADNCISREGNQPPRTGGKNGQKEYLASLFKTVKTRKGLDAQRPIDRRWNHNDRMDL
ncbi:MAG TPA: hypothetical protein VEZ90_10310 [Blastocatellia bacterium]|nr:hypothetical protein [Blastocatellia bacterium]